MDLNLDELGIDYDTDVALGPLTWFGVGGSAQVLARPADADQLAALMERCHERQQAVRVLGKGANLLVRDDGVDGVVIRLDAEPFAQIQIDDERVTAGAGYSLFKLVAETARQGLAGLEVLAGIPATVGGAVRMNAGGTHGDIGQTVRRVRTMDETGAIHDRDRDALVFGYRQSNIAEPLILEVEFELSHEDADEVVKRYKQFFMHKQASQPFADNSAGCAFKNPPAADGRKAGELIDRAGLKGYRIGAAQVSDVHANFIAAVDDGCTAADILALIDHVQQVVQSRFGVALEREVVVWP